MRRLGLVNTLLFLTLVPLWLVCFGLYLRNLAHGKAVRVPVFVAAPQTADEYPVVRGFWPGTGAERSGLEIGDRLTHVETSSLQGVGPFGFVARVYEVTGPTQRVFLSVMRNGADMNVALALHPLAFPWRTIVLTVGFAATAVLVLLRRPGLRVARAFFLAGMTYSLHWTFFAGGPLMQTYAWVVVLTCASVFMFPLILRVHLLLPEEFTRTGARLPWWPWLFAVYGPVLLSRVFGSPLPPPIGFQAEQIVTIAFVAILLVFITQQFRHAGPIGRRQFKWVAYGAYVGLAPVLAIDTLIAIVPVLWPLHEVATIFVALIPLGLCIAILRFNLLDIDRLISTTAALSLLVFVISVVAALLIPRIAHGVSHVVGIPHLASQTTLAVLFAFIIMPGQRYVRPWLERLFFPGNYAVARGVEALLRQLPQYTDQSALLRLAAERLDALWRPENCVIYRREHETYHPLFRHGSAVPPVIEAGSPFIDALQDNAAVLDMEQWRRSTHGYFRPVDRAVLDNLRAACLVSLSAHTPPSVFATLGVKQSGDVYTSTDRTLLATLAREITAALARIDERGVMAQAANR